MFTIGPERAGRSRSARLGLLRRARCLLLIPACVIVAPAGADPLAKPPQVTRVAAPEDVTGFGGAVVGLGDIDGDGVGDVAVGAGRSGRAYVITGDTVTILQDIASPLPGLEFGAALAAVGDVDRDGVGDLAVGAPPEPPIVAPPCPSDAECVDPEPVRGHVFVVSGTSGAIVRQWATERHLDFGRSVSGPGDLSGDGVPDVVVGAPGREEDPGVVLAYSGADGMVLWSRVEAPASTGPASAFGRLVVVTSDVTGDDVADLLVPASAGRVDVLSGADGAIVRSLSDPDSDPAVDPVHGDAANGDRDDFGRAVAAIGDQDGDGVVDHLVGELRATSSTCTRGRTACCSGRSRPLRTPATEGILALAAAGDRDGDGRGDVWIGVPSARAAFLINGTGALLASAVAPPEGADTAPAAASPADRPGRPPPPHPHRVARVARVARAFGRGGLRRRRPWWRPSRPGARRPERARRRGRLPPSDLQRPPGRRGRHGAAGRDDQRSQTTTIAPTTAAPTTTIRTNAIPTTTTTSVPTTTAGPHDHDRGPGQRHLLERIPPEAGGRHVRHLRATEDGRPGRVEGGTLGLGPGAGYRRRRSRPKARR